MGRLGWDGQMGSARYTEDAVIKCLAWWLVSMDGGSRDDDGHSSEKCARDRNCDRNCDRLKQRR